MIEEIKKAVHEAAAGKHKIAMFHFQVLKHASELRQMDPRQFCKEIAVPETYQTEFRKMISLEQLMRVEGFSLRRT